MLISFGQSSCPASFERWRWADLFSTTFLTGPDSEGVKVGFHGSRDFSTLETIDRTIHSEQEHVINESFDDSPFDGDCDLLPVRFLHKRLGYPKFSTTLCPISCTSQPISILAKLAGSQ